MIQRRIRDRGHFNTNIELMIFIAIIGILAAIAIPALLNYLGSRGRKCVEHLVELMDKTPAKAVECPKSSKPYVIAVRDEMEVIACPAPGEHLDTNPQFVRVKGRAWQLRQTLPPYDGKPVGFVKGRSVVTQSPGRASIHVLPDRSYRYFAGPVISGILGASWITMLVTLIRAIREKDRAGVVFWVIVLPLFGGCIYLLARDVASSYEIVLERAGAKVTRIEYHFGSRSSETVHAGCLGVIPSTGAIGGASRLLLVHDAEADGKRVTELDPIAGNRLDLTTWFNQVLIGP